MVKSVTRPTVKSFPRGFTFVFHFKPKTHVSFNLLLTNRIRRKLLYFKFTHPFFKSQQSRCHQNHAIISNFVPYHAHESEILCYCSRTVCLTIIRNQCDENIFLKVATYWIFPSFPFGYKTTSTEQLVPLQSTRRCVKSGTCLHACRLIGQGEIGPRF